jgi:chromosome segregation protein
VQVEAELLRHLEQRKERAAAIGEIERDITNRQEALASDESEQGSTRVAVESLRETTHEAELVRARAESDREHLDDLCRQELGVVASEAQAPEGEEDDEIDLDGLEEQIEQIRQRIDRIGPVNLTAIDEFSELEERNEFLTTQRSDLERSMESLRETIRRINRESRQRFTEVFEQIRESYREVYKLLFSGGRADLRLEEGEDVLESGIEILAQPPGKRLAGVHLLSGGEKALSAIALLFAIFRIQPSPFCLLDEVDAALDDSNVSRFTRMVGEYAKHTQFVIITHNKLSMESADLLYGVTMEEPGVSRLMSLQLG